MSTTLYADTNRVAEALEKAVEATDVGDEPTRVSVMDCDVVMRGIDIEEARERNLLHTFDEQVCSFKYDGTRMTLSFHENQVEETFTLNPAGTNAIAPEQATDPSRLAPSVGEVLETLEDSFDVVSYDFTEVSAASIANGGYFTSFEFEYVITVGF